MNQPINENLRKNSTYSKAFILNTAAIALVHHRLLLRRWIPRGSYHGDEYIVCNPKRHDGNPGSFKINCRSGRWNDFADDIDACKGDLVGLYAWLHECSQMEAAERIMQEIAALGPETEIAESIIKKAQTSDIVRDTEGFWCLTDKYGRTFRHQPQTDGFFTEEKFASRWVIPQYHRKPDRMWVYRDAVGHPSMIVIRFDQQEGKKEIRAWTYWHQRNDGKCFTKAGEWFCKALPEQRPLYGLDRLAVMPAAPVIIAEGEKATDAAGHLCVGYCPVGWSGGANAVNKSDWSALKNRRILLWPDNDEPGRKAMMDVATAARAAGAAEVRQLSLTVLSTYLGQTLTKGYDAADALEAG